MTSRGRGGGTRLSQGWQVASAAPGQKPETWIATSVPNTAAAALRAAGVWSLDGPARRFDAEEWWWRTRFAGQAGEQVTLCFDGLATVCDVSLNGTPLFESDNMFLAHEREVTLAAENELVIRCQALDSLLFAKRPRPRWRAPMVEHQQLRWFRTTLLGRTPGWSPPAAPVGPWRPIRILRAREPAIALRTRIVDGAGVVEADGEIVVERGGQTWRGAARVEIPAVERWWPHTHGEPALYKIQCEGIDFGAVGFRELALDRDDFGLRVNGVRIFCRGACWTPLDPVALASDRAALTDALVQARNAGMNMIRVGGTMVYETADFYDLCDELGILVWQDFMFANMDYPEEDAAFSANVTAEAQQVCAMLAARPSLAVVCGNSEGEQQAAMWGASRERFSPRLFHQTLPALCAEELPDVPYWPSSAHQGEGFPHQANAGTTSYYGVGAYLRPLDDARRAELRFATECLAFANLPDMVTAKVHDPKWKQRTPRDLGAGWDFDDVRDHYLRVLFGVDPVALRWGDHERYVMLSRVVTGEVMAATFGEWRRARSTCHGALVWFLRDLWAGAGWGVVEASGEPKAAYHYLRRALARVSVHISDEGGNGLYVHACNDGPAALPASLEITAYRGEHSVGRGAREVSLPARGALELSAAALFDGFVDLGWAYRFGPPMCDLVVATLHAPDQNVQAFHFPLGLPQAHEPDVGLEGSARLEANDARVTLRTRRFAQSVTLHADGFRAEDQYFHMAPGSERMVWLRRVAGADTPRIVAQPLNATSPTKIPVI